MFAPVKVFVIAFWTENGAITKPLFWDTNLGFWTKFEISIFARNVRVIARIFNFMDMAGLAEF